MWEAGLAWRPLSQWIVAAQTGTNAEHLHFQLGWGSQEKGIAYLLSASGSIYEQSGGFVGPRLQIVVPLMRTLGGRISLPLQTEIQFPLWPGGESNPWDSEIDILYERASVQFLTGLRFGETENSGIQKRAILNASWAPLEMLRIELGTHLDFPNAFSTATQWTLHAGLSFYLGQRTEASSLAGRAAARHNVQEAIDRVDREMSLIWLEAGSTAGLEVGQLYVVIRDAIPLARAQVIAVKADAAVLQIAQYFDGTPVLPGDHIHPAGL